MEHLLLLGGLILILFFLMSLISLKIKLPPLLAYMFLGIALVPFLTPQEHALIDEISKIGIILLFFLLGLDFPLTRLVNMTRRIWQAGSLDILLNFGVSAAIAYLFGFDLFSALVIGGVAYATSSSITLQLIKDTKRDGKPESEFNLGLLIFEDIAAPVVVSVLVGISIEGSITGLSLLIVFGKVVLMTLASLFVAYYVFRRMDLFVKLHSSKDFFLIFAVSIAFLLSGIAVLLGLSKLLGAFLAGVMLSEAGSVKNLTSQVIPLKDITLPFFFFWFGTSMTFGTGIILPQALLLLIIWAFAAKFIVGYWGGRIYGLTKKGSIRAALSLGQRGEFSIVIASLAEPSVIVFSGIYIIITALLGVFVFKQVPALTEPIVRLANKLPYVNIE